MRVRGRCLGREAMVGGQVQLCRFVGDLLRAAPTKAAALITSLPLAAALLVARWTVMTVWAMW